MWNDEQINTINQGVDYVIENNHLFYSKTHYARALLESIAPTLKATNTFVYTSRASRYYDAQAGGIQNRNGTQYNPGCHSIRAMVIEEIALKYLTPIPDFGAEPVANITNAVGPFQTQIRDVPNLANASDNLRYVVEWYRTGGNIPNNIAPLLKSTLSREGEDMIHLNLIKYGPPGTGKTYSLMQEVKIITGIEIEDNEKSNLYALIRESRSAKNQIEFVTFHQSYSYEEFIEGIRAEVVDGQVTYKIHNGIFKRLCRRAYFYKVESLVENDKKSLFTTDALKIYENLTFNSLMGNKDHQALAKLLLDYENENVTEEQQQNIPKFVLCIDEINRANISRVFGELITLIEDTKRQGAVETIPVTLPYSGDEFFVPDNLYIRGTMNTADRSLAKLDLALRRRFYFEAYYPDLDQVINGTARNILGKLNEFITRELDREHVIGHSYLMNISQNATEEEIKNKLSEAFIGKIIPLLEEYFLHDPSKVDAALEEAGATKYRQMD